MHIRLLAFLGVLASPCVGAQGTPSPDFPPEAIVFPDDQSLVDALSGKSYVVVIGNGPPSKVEYKANGYFYVNATNFNGAGKWYVKGASLCGGMRGDPDTCSPTRRLGDAVLWRRSSGELVRMTPQ